ncbi:hypothetical protein BC835DRAFT_809957 [Cytidiella melzeri]|nr:hypothetical protein BC835DRAFT_809957 [Cytidiella melzeri]
MHSVRQYGGFSHLRHSASFDMTSQRLPLARASSASSSSLDCSNAPINYVSASQSQSRTNAAFPRASTLVNGISKFALNNVALPSPAGSLNHTISAPDQVPVITESHIQRPGPQTDVQASSSSSVNIIAMRVFSPVLGSSTSTDLQTCSKEDDHKRLDSSRTTSSQLDPPAPRVMSRRSFAQLLEETRRRNRSNSQPTTPTLAHWTTHPCATPDLPSTLITPPPRTSSLSSRTTLTPGLSSVHKSQDSEQVNETIEELEQLAQRVRAVSGVSGSRSPTRRGFSNLARCDSPRTPLTYSEEERISDSRMASLSRTTPPQTSPTRGIASSISYVTRYLQQSARRRLPLPQIVITLPSSDDVVVASSETEDEVRWVDGYGKWSSHDHSTDNSDAESDVSSLFIAEECSDSSSACTSSPSSPPSDSKEPYEFTYPESRSVSPISYCGPSPGFTTSASTSLRLCHVVSTQVLKQRHRKLPQLKQAVSSPQIAALHYGHPAIPPDSIPIAPAPRSMQASHTVASFNVHIPPRVGGELQNSQSQSCWSVSTGSTAESHRPRWTAFKRLFHRSR